MKIQILSDKLKRLTTSNDITTNKLSDFKSFDNFDCVFIDLNGIWFNKNCNINNIDAESDIIDLGKEVQSTKKATVIIILPQNQEFCFGENNGKYNKVIEIKKTTKILHKIFNYFEPECYVLGDRLLCAKNNTLINGKQCLSDFYFKNSIYSCTLASISNKCTSKKHDNIILTTLDLLSNSFEENIFDFLIEIGLYKKKVEIPEWAKNITIFGDDQANEKIRECNNVIQEKEKEILKEQLILEYNNKVKSVLYTNGDELVNAVFIILEKIYDISLKEFVDEKKEDFRFKKDSYIYIGEIKGTNKGCKSRFVSQLDNHVRGYLDEHPDDKDCIIPLLIVSYENEIPIQNRNAITDEAIKIANRNGSLIIDTKVLLNIFSDLLAGKITKEYVIEMIKNTKGILVYDQNNI